jgi:DNA-binding MarR family transcriptional regulator
VRAETLAVLLPLAEARGRRLRFNELAERAGLSASGLTRRVEHLIGDGLVERVVCEADRRGAYAALTTAGIAAIPAALATQAAALQRAVGGRLSRAEVAILTELLERLSGGESDRKEA